MMTITPASTGTPTMNVKRPKEGGFYVTFSFWVLFCGGSFFFLYVSIKLKKFFITKNLVITYKLSTINGFYHKVSDFSTILVFLNFCYSLEEIAKKKLKNEIKDCAINMNV
jgi:hypothetical protein